MQMRIVLTYALLFLSSHTLACDKIGLTYGGWSNHYISSGKAGREESWNETHEALGVSCDRVGVLSFTNSWGEEAYGLSYSIPLENFSYGGIETELYTALWTGYNEVVSETGGIIPVGALKLNFRGLAVPSRNIYTSAYLTLGVSWVTIEAQF